MHARTALFIVSLVAPIVACSAENAPRDEVRYLDDAAYRRSELEASIVNPSNGYSRLRLEHYATGNAGDWDRLVEYNPKTEPIGAAELDLDGGASTDSFSTEGSVLALPDIVSVDDPALLALGKEAFERYPVQLAPYLRVSLASRDAARAYGLWLDPARGVGGIVRAQMADGSVALALTCTSCHAAARAGLMEDGLPNADLNLGAAILDNSRGALEPAVAAALAEWGRGRVDVTTSTGTEPARIPDLRPTRWQTYLHQDATLRVRGLTTLAIRIETLIISSSGQVLRPPRVVALALAAYIYSLGDGLPDIASAETASPQGAKIFAAACKGCHSSEALSGPPVPLESIGTEPTLGRSAERGTGSYRVPSLLGVGSRGPLLHDGTVPSIAALLDPARLTPSFTQRLHGAGAVAGHAFGLDLGDPDRAALIAYLKAL